MNGGDIHGDTVTLTITSTSYITLQKTILDMEEELYLHVTLPSTFLAATSLKTLERLGEELF